MDMVRLTNALAAVAPIFGVAVNTVNDKTTWTVAFNSASAGQQAAAAAAIADYDYSNYGDYIANAAIGIRAPMEVFTRLTADITTTSATYADVKDAAGSALSFPVAADEIWTAEWYLSGTGSTNGMKFQVTGPSGSVSMRITANGETTAVTVMTSSEQTAYSTPTAAFLVNIVPFTGRIKIEMCVHNGTTAGTVKLQYASASGGDSNTILTNSYMNARRIAVFTPQTVWNVPGSYTFTARTTGNYTFRAWGGGQSGGGTNLGAPGSGGIGGDYCQAVVALTANDVVNIVVGAGGAASASSVNSGADSKGTVSAVDKVLAKGGNSGSANVGSTQFAGGTAGIHGGANNTGGGGGGGGGITGAGGAGGGGGVGVGGTGGTAVASAGIGGTGGLNTAVGGAGTKPGGGGGGAGNGGANSGAGGDGRFEILTP